MARRKKRKQRKSKSGKWKLIFLFLTIILIGGGAYYIYSGRNLNDVTTSIGVEKAFSYAIDGAEKVKDEIVSQAENVSPYIDKVKDKISGNKNEESLPAGSVPKLNLEIPKYTSTSTHDEIILHRTGYTVSYNTFYKTPNWVAWELTREETKGNEGRTDKFVPDPDLPEPRVQHSDYTRSGYDRGHMAPAADMKWSKKAMKESFYMSNICPQVGNLNRGDWNDLEEECRKWAGKYGTVYIACGPIFDSTSPKRIGKNKVGVPDRFFKVVLIYNRKNPMAMGFLFRNKANSQDLKKYMVTVDSIEEITGLDFFSKLPDSIENRIEAEIPEIFN